MFGRRVPFLTVKARPIGGRPDDLMRDKKRLALGVLSFVPRRWLVIQRGAHRDRAADDLHNVVQRLGVVYAVPRLIPDPPGGGARSGWKSGGCPPTPKLYGCVRPSSRTQPHTHDPAPLALRRMLPPAR